MAYPTLPTTDSSRKEPIDSRILVRATNGSMKARLLHPTEKSRFTLVHFLTSSERDTLETHYSSNSTASFDYTWLGTEGGTSTVIYAERPRYEQFGLYYAGYVTLEEV